MNLNEEELSDDLRTARVEGMREAMFEVKRLRSTKHWSYLDHDEDVRDDALIEATLAIGGLIDREEVKP